MARSLLLPGVLVAMGTPAAEGYFRSVGNRKFVRVSQPSHAVTRGEVKARANTVVTATATLASRGQQDELSRSVKLIQLVVTVFHIMTLRAKPVA